MNKNFIIIIIALLFVAVGAYILYPKERNPIIGGDRDLNGCLTPAGFSFDGEVGACIRDFEMTPDIKTASKIAVDNIGKSYALTVTSFNSFEEEGSYDIFLERGEEREKIYVYIRGWKVVEPVEISLFYYNPEKDKDQSGNIMCSKDGLVEVRRKILPTENVIEEAVKLLISGDISAQDEALGTTTEYPLDGFYLARSSLNNGILTLEFVDPQNQTVGGACRVGILWAQIEETARQFEGVEEVRFIPEEIFQP